MDVYGLPDVPGDPLAFPVNNGKTFRAYGVSCGWLWWCIEDGALRCSLSLSPRVLPDSPIYSSRQLIRWHVMDSALRSSVSLGDREVGPGRGQFFLSNNLDSALRSLASLGRGMQRISQWNPAGYLRKTAPCQTQPHTGGH